MAQTVCSLEIYFSNSRNKKLPINKSNILNWFTVSDKFPANKAINIF